MGRIRNNPPFSPKKTRQILKNAGVQQKYFAEKLNITRGAVTHYINGVAYSQRFWNCFYEVTGLKKAS